MITTKIIVTFTQPGFHSWPTAPEHRIYLRDSHRHLFHFKVTALVTSSREVEFHDLLEAAKLLIVCNGDHYFLSASCEEIAQRLGEDLRMAWPVMEVECWEDGECGARVSWS